MIDGHERCEWVMFLLVLVHPVCPGQNPETREIVIVVILTKRYLIIIGGSSVSLVLIDIFL